MLVVKEDPENNKAVLSSINQTVGQTCSTKKRNQGWFIWVGQKDKARGMMAGEPG